MISRMSPPPVLEKTQNKNPPSPARFTVLTGLFSSAVAQGFGKNGLLHEQSIINRLPTTPATETLKQECEQECVRYNKLNIEKKLLRKHTTTQSIRIR